MAFTKIKESDYESKGIRVQSSTLELPVAECQRLFDELPLDVLIPAFNRLITELNTYQTANNTAVLGKVDKVTGKGLSANDYTDTDKVLVGTISDKANSSDVLLKNNSAEFMPVSPYNPATKKYVDERVNDIIVETGSADMMKAVYDKNNKNTDIFEYVDERFSTVDTTTGVQYRIGIDNGLLFYEEVV